MPRNRDFTFEDVLKKWCVIMCIYFFVFYIHTRDESIFGRA